MFFKGSRYENVATDSSPRRGPGDPLQDRSLHPPTGPAQAAHVVTRASGWTTSPCALPRPGALLAHLRRQPRAVAGRPPRRGGPHHSHSGLGGMTGGRRHLHAVDRRHPGRAGPAAGHPADRGRGPRGDGRHAAPARRHRREGRLRGMVLPGRRALHPPRQPPPRGDRGQRTGRAAHRRVRHRDQRHLRQPARDRPMLNVVAMDPTVLMNLDEKVKPWPNMADSDIASAIFADAEYKFTPVVDATQWSRQENDHTLDPARHRHPVPAAAGRPQRLRVLRGDQRPHGDVEGHFHPPRHERSRRACCRSTWARPPTSTASTPATTCSGPPRRRRPPSTSRVAQNQPATGRQLRGLTELGEATALDAAPAARVLLSQTGLAAPARCSATRRPSSTGRRWSIVAEGELNTVAYGGVLRAKRPVMVRGVGQQFSGTYYVERGPSRADRRCLHAALHAAPQRDWGSPATRASVATRPAGLAQPGGAIAWTR